MAIVRHQLEPRSRSSSMHETEPRSFPRVQGNANQIQQVLINLMMNAQQAMEGEAGKSSPSRPARCSHRHEIEIRRAGQRPGDPSEDIQEKIFEPFFTTKPGGKGTGLGLSVSFGIVKDHGGEVLLQSVLGQGTQFTIVLPVEGSAPAPAPSRSTQEAAVSA